MKVEWRIDGIYKADAQKVADEIGNDRISPAEVLEKARDVNSELHKCFEWNDSIAAEKYRLQQARGILINLVYKEKESNAEPVRTFQITSQRNVYQPTVSFVVQEDEYQNLLKRAKSELESFKKRYHTLSELQEVFEAIALI